MRHRAARQRRLHLLLAFCAGVLAAWAGSSLAPRLLPPGSFGRLLRQMEGMSSSAACLLPARPGVALSPRYLQLAANDSSATTQTLIVAARSCQDTSWLDVWLPQIPHVVYQVAPPEETVGAQHATLAGRGREAMGYLQFVIDYYDRLPNTTVFIHGQRGSWHMRDHVPVLARLRWGHLPYANLRYRHTATTLLQWACGNEFDDPVFQWGNQTAVRRGCDWVGNTIRPHAIQPRAAADVTPLTQEEWYDSVEMHAVWGQLFEQDFGALPELITGPCCAEFMVSRERILSHSRDFYVRLRQWLITTELDSYRAGRVLEYMWPVIFGEGPVTEPVDECELLHCQSNMELSDAGRDADSAAKQLPY